MERDYVSAVLWSFLAEVNGNDKVQELAQELRDLLFRRVTAAQLAEAHKRAKACFETGYKTC